MPAEERRSEILAAARTVFARSGFAGARTRDIAAEAGINEAMLYRHFQSKDELFEAAVAQPLEDAVATVAASVGPAAAEYSVNAEALREQARQFVSDLYDVMTEVAPLLGVILFSDADRAREYFRKRIKPNLKQLEALLKLEYDSWPHRDYDPEALVEWLFAITWFSATIDKLTKRKRNRYEVAGQIIDLIVDGLLIPTE